MSAKGVSSMSGVAAKVLAICAWLTLMLAIAVGIIGADPTLSRLIRVPGAVLVVFLWGAALWHEWLDPRRRSVPQWAVLLLLVLGNFVAAFFYYFLFVLWRTPSGSRESSSNSAA